MKLKAELKNDQNDAVRESGNIPAVVYGKQEESGAIKINASEFLKLYKEAGTSTIFELEVDGDSKDVLIKEVQKHPVSGDILHADFYAIERGVEIEIDVSVEFIGEAPAAKTGVVIKSLNEIKVKTIPRNMPSQIEVDLAKLEEVGQSISVADLDVIEGVTFMNDPADVIVSVTAQRTAEEAQEAEGGDEAPDMDAIESEGEKPEAEGEGEDKASE